MVKLNRESAIKHAKELTTTAIEHDLIVKTPDPVKTAENVYEFYSTLYDKLSGESSK